MFVRDIEMIKNFNLLIEKKIVLFGAGDYGRRAKEYLDNVEGAQLLAYLESNPIEWKKKNASESYEGIPVMGIDELREQLNSDDCILITSVSSQHVSDVVSYIEKIMPELECLYTWFGLHFSVEFNINDSRINPEYREKFSIMQRYKRGKKSQYYLDGMYQLFKGTSVLIYQPGKVGSSTIHRSIVKHGVEACHIHHINPYNEYKYVIEEGNYNEMREWWWEHRRKKDNIKIISLVRDPIAQSISVDFQGFYEDYKVNDLSVADIFEIVNNGFKTRKGIGNYGAMFNWFDDEIKAVFGIDIYEYPFDREKGYTIIKKDNVELLLMTMEQMNDNEKVVGDFVGVSDFKYTMENVGSNKGYKYAYKEVMDNIELDDEILDFYYKSNPCMDHFYTEEQKSKFLKKWKHNE